MKKNEAKIENKDDLAIITIKGKFGEPRPDRFLVAEFDALTEGYAQECEKKGVIPKIIVDLKKVTFVSSIGLAALLKAVRRVGHLQGDLILVNIDCVGNGRFHDLLRVCRLERVFTITSMRKALKK